MIGHDDDLMLRLNSQNCPKFSKGLQEHEQHVDELTKEYQKSFYPRLAEMMGQASVTRSEAVDLCEYINWADLHEVELTISATQDDFKNCAGLLTAVDEYVNFVDEQLGNLGSNQFK